MIRGKTLILIMLLLATITIAFVIDIFWRHGISSYESFNYAGLKRSYILHIPPGYDNETQVPLVIVLHGLGGTSRDMEQLTRMSLKSDAEGFIVVYPEGFMNSWNAILPIGYAFDNNVDDVGFIRELIDILQRKLAIDGNRIYVAGFSQGAMLAYRLTAELSDKIAAAAAVAGAIGCRATPDSPLNTIREYHSYIFLSVNESVIFWVKHDGCSEEPLIEVDSSGGIIKDTYGGGANGTEVVLYMLVNGEHSWPVPFATDEAWEFFKNHPKE